jgi:hypothetical protein
MAGWTVRIDDPELQQDADQILIDAAAGADLDDQRIIAQAAYEAWREREPDPDEEPRGRGFGDRYLHLETTLDGAGRISGDLTPECAAAGHRRQAFRCGSHAPRCHGCGRGKLDFIDLRYHRGMQGMGGFRTLFARLAERRGTAGQGAFEWTPEAERMRSALEMHELGVQLYRQRMHREHPEASRAEIDGLVRGWLTAPPSRGRLRLPSREQGHGYAR